MSDTTDPAERVETYLNACVTDATPGATRYAIAMRLEGVPDEGRDELAADDLRAVLDELKQLRAEVAAIAADAKPGHAMFVRHQSIGALTGAVAICQQALDDLRAAGYGGLVDQYTATYAGQDDGGLSAAIEAAAAKPESTDGAR